MDFSSVKRSTGPSASFGLVGAAAGEWSPVSWALSGGPRLPRRLLPFSHGTQILDSNPGTENWTFCLFCLQFVH